MKRLGSGRVGISDSVWRCGVVEFVLASGCQSDQGSGGDQIVYQDTEVVQFDLDIRWWSSCAGWGAACLARPTWWCKT